METELQEEYDLDVVELTEFYNKICKLFELKSKFVDDFYKNYSYDESSFINYLLLRKIEDILK